MSIAENEINEIITEVLSEGIHPMASIALADVRKLMILSWDRGYSVALEENSNEAPRF